MLDRESTFADVRVRTFLKQKTVAVAIDQWNHRRQKDTEGEFWRKVVKQSPRMTKNFEGTTQGLYLISPDGTLLSYTNNRNPDRVLQSLMEGYADFEPTETDQLKIEKVDRRYAIKPPEGGLTLRVRAKVLSGYKESKDRWQKIFQKSVSRDNMWITAEEHQALVAGEFPQKLGRRMARYHLVDNTRGEAPAWKSDELLECSFSREGDLITGAAVLKTRNGKTSYNVKLRGRISTDGKRVTKFQMAAKGLFEGAGPYTPNPPPGKFPLAITLTLADGSDVADALIPQVARGWVDGYYDD